MKKALLWGLLAFAVAIMGCAGGQLAPTERAVYTYEDVGFSLSVAYSILTQMEADGSLTGDQLIKTKAMYNEARSAFLIAGDAMKQMINSPDPVVREDARGMYRQSLLLAANIAMQLSKLIGGK